MPLNGSVPAGQPFAWRLTPATIWRTTTITVVLRSLSLARMRRTRAAKWASRRAFLIFRLDLRLHDETRVHDHGVRAGNGDHRRRTGCGNGGGRLRSVTVSGWRSMV